MPWLPSGDRTVNELAAQVGVHPTLIHGWKKQLLSQADTLFANGSQAATTDAEAKKNKLFEQIGWLDASSTRAKRSTASESSG